MPSSVLADLTLKKGEYGNYTSWRDVENQLILPYWELLDVFGKTSHEPWSIAMHIISFCGILIGWIDKRYMKSSHRLSWGMSHVRSIRRDYNLGMWCIGEGPTVRVAPDKGSSTWAESWCQRTATRNPHCHPEEYIVELPMAMNSSFGEGGFRRSLVREG